MKRLLALVALLLAPVVHADPTTFTCTSTSHGMPCAFAGSRQDMPAPVASGVYAFADHGFAEAVALGVCPSVGTCIHEEAAGATIDATERPDPSGGERTYAGTLILP